MLSRRKTNVKIKGSNRKVEIVQKRVDLNDEKNKCKMKNYVQYNFDKWPSS